METRFLESLIAIVDKGSVAEAARLLNVTPTALAMRIQTLESEIGSKLLVRSGRTLAPTPIGGIIVDRARGILQDVRGLRAIAIDGEAAGELRIGAIETAMTGLLPTLLKRACRDLPRLDVFIEPGTSRDLYPKVLSGELDAAILIEPDFTLPKICDWRVLREDGLIVIAPAALTEADPHTLLRTEPFLRYDRHQWGGRLADTYLRQTGIRVRQRFELDSLDAIAVLVDQGLGISLVPDWPPPWPDGLNLQKIPLHDCTLKRRTGALWRRTAACAHNVRAFFG